MASPRPGSVTAAGVLSIIYGSLFTLCGMCGLIFILAQGAIGKNFRGGGDDPMVEQFEKELEAAMRKDVPGYETIGTANTVLGLGEAIALFCAGIGLFNLKTWARKVALAVCLITIAHVILEAVYQSVFVIPAVNRVFQEVLPAFLARNNAGAPNLQAFEFLRTLMIVVAVVTVIIYVLLVVYLFIIVMLLSRPHVRAAFAAAAAGPAGGPADSQIPPGAYEDDPGWTQDPNDDRFRAG